MKRYSYLDSKAGRPLFWCFLLALLLLARDTLVTSVVVGFTRSQLLLLAILALAGAGFLFVHRKDWRSLLSDRRMILLLLCAGLLLVPMVLKRDWQMMYLSILLCLLTAVFLTFFRSLKEVARGYVVILAVLGLWSLVTTFVLKDLAASGALRVPQVVNSSGWTFYNFGLSYVVTWERWYRNFGIFREPGVYQFFLILGLYLNNYETEWENSIVLWCVNVILAVTMLSTFAVGGILELGLFILFLYVEKKWYKTRWGKLLAAAAVIAVVVVACQLAWLIRHEKTGKYMIYELYDMFIRLFTDSESSSDRFGAIAMDLQLFVKNPLLGSGIGNVLHAVPNNTSSTLILYAIVGIFGGTWSVLAWIALVWRRERHVIGNLFLLMILFMSFNTQNLTADLFFWLFPMMALTERWVPLLKRKV